LIFNIWDRFEATCGDGDKTENIRQLAYRAPRYNARIEADIALVRKLLERYKKEE
jgi:hypothetical protein